MLALYAFNAPPEVMKRHFDDNMDYQLPLKPVDKTALQDLQDPAKFSKYLFQRDRYHDYLALFEGEIQTLGVKQTLAKYLFAKDEQAKDMLNRLYAGPYTCPLHGSDSLTWQQASYTL